MPTSRHERVLRRAGYRSIAGVDEAGRGSLFGPVFAAAVILDPARPIRGLDDSKQLAPERREVLASRIRERAVAWAVAGADAFEIDRINILQASRLAMRRAVEILQPACDYLLVDFVTVDVALPQGAHSEKKPGKESDLIVSIKQDGTVFIGQDWIPDRDLPRYMKAEHDKNAGRNVMVKADKRINFGKVRMVMKAANDADFTAVSFLTENQMAGKQIAQEAK